MGKLRPPIAGFMPVSEIQAKLGQVGSGGEQTALRWQRWGINPSKVVQGSGGRKSRHYWYSPTRVRMIEKLYAKYATPKGHLPPRRGDAPVEHATVPTRTTPSGERYRVEVEPRPAPRAQAMFPPQLMNNTTMENHLQRLVTQNDKIIELLIELKAVWK